MKIKSFSELKKLVESIKTDDLDKPIVVIQKDDNGKKIPVTIPAGSNNMARRLLTEGFDMVKNQKEYAESLQLEVDEEDFGGYAPAVIENETLKNLWVDRFVEQHLGGYREGLKVIWSLPEGKFELDPWSLSLTKAQ